MLDPGLAEVGFADPELGPGTFPAGRDDGHFARGDGNDDIVHLMDVMTGGAARRQPPFGDPDFGGVDLNLGFGTYHDVSRRITARTPGTGTPRTPPREPARTGYWYGRCRR